MTDDELKKFTSSIQEKLGEENSALIADDLGLLMTGNANAQNALRDRDQQIKDLQERNEKLVLANGNLLRQIPMGVEPDKPYMQVQQKEESDLHSFRFKDAFDEKGRFK